MDIREEFEKLDEIAEILKDEDTHWCDKRGMYINQRVFQDSTTGYLNGAWYAFQEQQKTIDIQDCGATEILMIIDDSEYDDSTKIKRIKELLK